MTSDIGQILRRADDDLEFSASQKRKLPRFPEHLKILAHSAYQILNTYLETNQRPSLDAAIFAFHALTGGPVGNEASEFLDDALGYFGNIPVRGASENIPAEQVQRYGTLLLQLIFGNALVRGLRRREEELEYGRSTELAPAEKLARQGIRTVDYDSVQYYPKDDVRDYGLALGHSGDTATIKTFIQEHQLLPKH